MIYRFKTPDVPKDPHTGDVRFTLSFPTDDGGMVYILLGERGFQNHCRAVQDALADMASTKEREL